MLSQAVRLRRTGKQEKKCSSDQEKMIAHIEAEPLAKTDYVEIVELHRV